MAWTVYPLAMAVCFVAAFVAALLGRALQRRVIASPHEIELRSALPGHDCGLCGYDECKAYARSLAGEKGDPGRCAPGGGAVEAKLRALVGGEAEIPKVAVVHCAGGHDEARYLFHYEGAGNCHAAIGIYGGPKACGNACTGLGSCIVHCPTEAISVREGLAVIDAQRCTGCGRCVTACPVAVIELVRRDLSWYIACNSRDDLPSKRLNCSVPCTACGECERRSDAWQFSVRDNLAKVGGFGVDRAAKSETMTDIAGACPTGAIRSIAQTKRRASLSATQASDYTSDTTRQG